MEARKDSDGDGDFIERHIAMWNIGQVPRSRERNRRGNV